MIWDKIKPWTDSLFLLFFVYYFIDSLFLRQYRWKKEKHKWVEDMMVEMDKQGFLVYVTDGKTVVTPKGESNQ